MRVIGIDFTSTPTPAKPLRAAHGILAGDTVVLDSVEPLAGFPALEALLRSAGPWVMALDLPFGLPAEFVRDQGWPLSWAGMVERVRVLDRAAWRALLDAHRLPRPAGDRLPHRRTDRPASSHSPLKLVNPPVALMFHEGAPRLLASGVELPGLQAGDPSRIAVEGYPGLWARRILRDSYKSDDRARQTPERDAARARLLAALEAGRPGGIALECSAAQRRALQADKSGDSIDAAICCLQAGWAARSGPPHYGLPPQPLAPEGWIISCEDQPAAS